MARFVILAMVVSSSAVPIQAHAAPGSPTEVPPADSREDTADISDAARTDRGPATEAYERGMQAYANGAYREALAEFERAEALDAANSVQYDIGRCHEALGEKSRAIAAYQRYLSTAPTAADRAEVKARIVRLAGQTPTPTPVPVVRPERRPDRRTRGLIVAGATLIGTGAGAALGGALGFGVLALRRSRALDEVTTSGNPNNLTYAQARALQRDGERYEQLGAATAGLGAAVAMVGAVLVAYGARRRQAARARFAGTCPGPGQLCFTIEARF